MIEFIENIILIDIHTVNDLQVNVILLVESNVRIRHDVNGVNESAQFVRGFERDLMCAARIPIRASLQRNQFAIVWCAQHQEPAFILHFWELWAVSLWYERLICTTHLIHVSVEISL